VKIDSSGGIRDFARHLKEKLGHDDILTQSAALALYTAFALAPLVILLLTFLSSLGLSLQQQLTSQVRQLMGAEAASVLESIMRNSSEHSASAASLWGILVLAVSASVIFAQLQSSLNLIFESKIRLHVELTWKEYIRLYLTRRLVCFGMILTFIFISIVSLVISGVLSLFATGHLAFWAKSLQLVGSFLVYSILFAIILHWMPDRKVPWAAAFHGGLITAVLFMVGKVLISLYIGQTAVGSAYGAAGSLVVLLSWVYYSSLIVLLGAEISSILCRMPERIS